MFCETSTVGKGEGYDLNLTPERHPIFGYNNFYRLQFLKHLIFFNPLQNRVRENVRVVGRGGKGRERKEWEGMGRQSY